PDEWFYTTGKTQIDFAHYDNGTTGLGDITAGQYGCHWVYLHPDDEDVYVVYGRDTYKLAAAEVADAPNVPDIISDFGLLLGCIIVPHTGGIFTTVQMVTDTFFVGTAVATHNNLGGIQGGAANDYYHLTNSQHSELTDWAGEVTLSTGGAINLVTFSTGGTVNIPSGQEYQISGSEVKLDEWATPSTGTALNSSTGRHGLLIALDGSTGNYLRGDGSWQTPPDTDTNTFVGLTDTPVDFSGGANKLLRVDSSSGAVEFTSSTGINHNDLGALDTADYQHLTQAEHDEVTPWLGSVTLSTGGTIDIPTGQEYQISSAKVKLDDWNTPGDNTDLNATTGYHGLLKKLDNNDTHWMNGKGNWTAPTASEVGALESSGAFTVNRIPQITSTGGVLKASVFTVTTGDVFDFGAHSAGFSKLNVV
ncbi:unnamed protein product, partial [marine sediment metagenome]